MGHHAENPHSVEYGTWRKFVDALAVHAATPDWKRIDERTDTTIQYEYRLPGTDQGAWITAQFVEIESLVQCSIRTWNTQEGTHPSVADEPDSITFQVRSDGWLHFRGERLSAEQAVEKLWARLPK
jgi:hypothetical protein